MIPGQWKFLAAPNPCSPAAEFSVDLLDPARNLDAILVALRSNGEREKEGSRIHQSKHAMGRVWEWPREWSGNGLKIRSFSTKHQTTEGLGRHDVQRE